MCLVLGLALGLSSPHPDPRPRHWGGQGRLAAQLVEELSSLAK